MDNILLFKKRYLLVLLIPIILLWAPTGLRLFGKYLVTETDYPKPVDVIVVLSGGTGERIEYATQLYKQGVSKTLLMNGGGKYFDRYYSEYMKDYAIRLVLATHAQGQFACDIANQYVRYGSSPRGVQALILAANVEMTEGNLIEAQRLINKAQKNAPDLDRIGILLPYTPLHHLLMDKGFSALVMTSANLSEEPICTDNSEALQRLSNGNTVVNNWFIHKRRTDSAPFFEVTPEKKVVWRAPLAEQMFDPAAIQVADGEAAPLR